jgi:hypothetical protein
MPHAAGLAEGEPASPGPAFVLVCCLSAGVTDDSAICSTSVIQDKISFGNREMEKSGGICVGWYLWKGAVSRSSSGLSRARGWGFSRDSPSKESKSETTVDSELPFYVLGGEGVFLP